MCVCVWVVSPLGKNVEKLEFIEEKMQVPAVFMDLPLEDQVICPLILLFK